jgi:hypothetical protein
MTITFSRSHGGYVVRLDRNLIGLLLAPRPHESEWRILTEYGECASAPTLQDAKRLAADFLILDYAA